MGTVRPVGRSVYRTQGIGLERHLEKYRMSVIQYENVCKKFAGSSKYAVDHVSAEIESGEFITILGSSGCGKTTLLKLTNRLYDPDDGKIIVEGVDIKTVDPVELRRRLGYVIQQVGLFPHMTIKENITVIPSLMKWDKRRMDERADELLKLVGLEPAEFRDRYPHQLSAIGRATAEDRACESPRARSGYHAARRAVRSDRCHHPPESAE